LKLALVGDIGGTNARFALWKNQQLESVQVLATADHASPEEAISLYLSGLGLAPGSIGSVCLSVAGPVSGDEFKFTNNHWRLSRTAFCKTLQVDELLLVNDFSAMALGMTRLQPGEFRVVCEGTPEPLRPAVVIGPGTGLGVGTLLDLGEGRLRRCRGGRARRSAPEQPA
jgi:glucokinase